MQPANGRAPALRSAASPRRSAIYGIAGVLLLVVAAGGARLALPSWILRQMRDRGALVEPSRVELHWQRVVLRDARVRLVDVHGLDARVASLTIELEGFVSPARVVIEGATVAMVGGEPLTDVPRWLTAHALTGDARAKPIPASVERMRVAWRPSDRDDRPWIEIADVALDRVAAEGRLRHARVDVLGHDLGAHDLAYAWRPDAVALGLDADQSARAALHASISRAPSGITIEAALEPSNVGALAAVTSLSLPGGAATVAAHASLAIPIPPSTDADVSGTASAEVTGWTPPHPAELDGILFGDHTTIGASLHVSDRTTADLDDVRVGAGALALRGKGKLELGEASRLELHLDGRVACTELAHSAALSRLGRELGDIAGQLARRTLTGSVLVHIDVAADPRRLDQARIERTATVKCRARGL